LSLEEQGNNARVLVLSLPEQALAGFPVSRPVGFLGETR